MTGKQIEDCLSNFKWKWEIESIYDENHVFSCWRLKGFGNDSAVYLVLDIYGDMIPASPLSVTANGEKTIIHCFSKIMAEKLISVTQKMLKNRIRAQKHHVKRAK